MGKLQVLKMVAGFICLLACAACTPNATDFIQISGYDASGVRTGHIIPSAGVLTP